MVTIALLAACERVSAETACETLRRAFSAETPECRLPRLDTNMRTNPARPSSRRCGGPLNQWLYPSTYSCG
jgi:hypothetical protein